MFCFLVNISYILKLVSASIDILSSFKYAMAGLKAAIKKEPNFRIHLLIACATLITAAILGFTKVEWLLLTFTITFVLLLELINTTLESIVDMVSPKLSEKARIAKDVSAAAVLLSAILAVIVGLTLFIPKILARP